MQDNFFWPFIPFGPPFGPPRPVRPPFRPPGPGPRPGPWPGRPPFGPGEGAPTTPPPPYIPEQAPYRVDPGTIKQCRNKYTYVWLDNGRSFWFYPTYVGRKSISGYRWIGFMWVYYGTDLNRIDSFICY